ncbi:unnamed protein product [Phytophthora lilii]|uniref:Unnamed protein product n=1 Tax=Phytophthora lilii TaxID=2077276 RepID=A0A9W6XJR9_9STRA|nr:unnamed protein product [Phytophthora lilii]
MQFGNTCPILYNFSSVNVSGNTAGTATGLAVPTLSITADVNGTSTTGTLADANHSHFQNDKQAQRDFSLEEERRAELDQHDRKRHSKPSRGSLPKPRVGLDPGTVRRWWRSREDIWAAKPHQQRLSGGGRKKTLGVLEDLCWN